MDTNINEMCEKCHYRITAEKNKPPDMGQLLKLAMMVSKMFSQAGRAKPQADPDSFEKPHSALVPHRPFFSMDAIAEDKTIKIIKASLPYLDPACRQVMHILAKCMELKNIMNPEAYSSRASLCAAPRPSALGMLSAVKPHLEPDEQAALTIASKALEMVEVFRMMDSEKPQTTKEPPSFENIDKTIEG